MAHVPRDITRVSRKGRKNLTLDVKQTTVSIGTEALRITEEYAKHANISRSWACYLVFEASPLLAEWKQSLLDSGAVTPETFNSCEETSHKRRNMSYHGDERLTR